MKTPDKTHKKLKTDKGKPQNPEVIEPDAELTDKIEDEKPDNVIKLELKLKTKNKYDGNS